MPDRDRARRAAVSPLRRVNGAQGDIADVVAVGTGLHVALAVTDTVHVRTAAVGHFTPDEARMIAAALIDVADALDHVEA